MFYAFISYLSYYTLLHSWYFMGRYLVLSQLHGQIFTPNPIPTIFKHIHEFCDRIAKKKQGIIELVITFLQSRKQDCQAVWKIRCALTKNLWLTGYVMNIGYVNTWSFPRFSFPVFLFLSYTFIETVKNILVKLLFVWCVIIVFGLCKTLLLDWII